MRKPRFWNAPLKRGRRVGTLQPDPPFPGLNQPTLRMETIGAAGFVAAIFTPITSSHDC
jgi:hypothetical protein